MTPNVSIVIVTYNDRVKLFDCLSSLRQQTYPPAKRELIVVDDGSTDGTAKYLHSTFPEAKVIEKANSGPDNSRMYGIKAAKGEIVAFIDSDCIAYPDWLEKIVFGLIENQSAIIGGQILHRGSFLTRVIGISDFGELQGEVRKEVTNIPTCNMGVKREVFKQFGFHPQLRIGGDVLFCNQLRINGQRLLYDPKIKVIHRPEVSFRSFLKRAYRYGQGFIYIRRIEASLHHTALMKYGLPGIMITTLGRTFLDWYRLFRHRKDMLIAQHEFLPAMFVLFLKRVFSLFGAVNGYRTGSILKGFEMDSKEG